MTGGRRFVPVLAAILLLAWPRAAGTLGVARYVGQFDVTYYWVAEEDGRDVGQPRTEALRDRAGRVLARVAPTFARRIRLEGTGRLPDGRLLNVDCKIDGRWRFRVVKGSGVGAGGRGLRPFTSVATDPSRIPTGSVLLLPDFAGQVLPGGARHPGCFVADDVGGAIKGNRIDVFIGAASRLRDFERRVPSHGTVPVFLVAGG